MPVFTAVAAFVSAAVGGGVFGAIAGFAARTLLTVGITKLIANRTGTNAAGTSDVGSRVHVPPASNNKLPIVYGKAYMGSTVTDMKISEDQKKMWYVCAISEVTDTTAGSGFTFGNIYWSGKKVIFDGTDTSKVIALETNSDPVQTDDKVNGKIHIYKFPNGSSSGISTGGSNAITLMSDSSIPADLRWNSALYTTGGQSAQMQNVAFLIVTVEYDTNAGTTQLVPLNVEITNSLYQPGSVIKDYLLNERYGCGVPLAQIDTASLTALDAYSAEQITYTPVGGGSATQNRYKINGPVQTGDNCLTNLQQLVDACDSWLQYSELDGKWKVVINKPYDGLISSLYQVTDSNLMSGINVNPIDLNSAYNKLEVQYPNSVVLDKTDYAIFDLVDFAPEVMSPNEPENQLTVQFSQVNNYIQSAYLGQRRLLQSREDLVIDFALDYSGIQIEAGDVIAVKFTPYGWETFNSGYGKLFRVSQVQEAKIDDGTLGVKITAFEYNPSIYTDNPIQDFVPEANTGLTDPSIFSKPSTPIVTLAPVANGAINYYTVSSNVPAVGSTLYMDFNIGNSSNILTHKSYNSVQVGSGTPYTANSTVTINVSDSSPGTYYWSATARNDLAGSQSNSSAAFTWVGPSVSEWDANANLGGITGNNIANNAITSSKLANSGVVAGNYSYANITVDSKGLITLASNGSFANIGNIQVPTVIDATNFSIRSFTGGSPNLPLDVTSTSTRNIPVYIDGTGIDDTNGYPWYQGTSNNGTSGTSGNLFYGTNSTGTWTPNDAGTILVADGDDLWYGVLTNTNIAGKIGNTNGYQMNYGFTVVSDTNGAILQVVEGVENSNLGYSQVYTDQFHTMYLFANMPQSFTKVKYYGAGTATANFTGGTVFVRNVTPGATITIIQGSLASYKIGNPFI